MNQCVRKLSAREWGIINAIAKGMSNREIAEKMIFYRGNDTKLSKYHSGEAAAQRSYAAGDMVSSKRGKTAACLLIWEDPRRN